AHCRETVWTWLSRRWSVDILVAPCRGTISGDHDGAEGQELSADHQPEPAALGRVQIETAADQHQYRQQAEEPMTPVALPRLRSHGDAAPALRRGYAVMCGHHSPLPPAAAGSARWMTAPTGRLTVGLAVQGRCTRTAPGRGAPRPGTPHRSGMRSGLHPP